MKKTLLILTCLMSSLMTFAQFSGSGSGTASDPYKIFNPIQLAQMANFLNNENVVFELKANIDLSDYISENYPSEGWAPIGTSAAPFKGMLKGNNYTISGLSINRSSTDYVGLFGSVSNATLSDFRVRAKSIEGRSFTGVLVGQASASTIKNITITTSSKVSGNSNTGSVFGSVSGTCNGITAFISSPGVLGTTNIGGMAGSTSASFSSCSITAQVTASGENCGGFTGKASGNPVFTSCKQNGEVSGENNTSGFCGKSEGTPTFTNCWSRGRVTGIIYTGGILGYGDFLSMTGCSHSGDVSGNENVGGVYGGNDDTSEEYPIYNFSTSNTENISHGCANDILEYTNTKHLVRGDQVYRTIVSCSSVGKVTGSSNVGGLVGHCLIKRAYRFKEINKVSYTDGLYDSFGSSRYVWRNGVSLNILCRSGIWQPTDYVDITTLQLSNCYHNGEVKGGSNAGGIVGYNAGGTIQACYSNAKISGSSNIGGIVGYIAGGIKDNFSTNATITSSAAINSVVNSTSTATGTIGRIYGSKGNYVTIGANGTNEGNISINNTSVVANGNILSVTDDPQNGTATGPAMLKLQATYVAKGWDFANGWSIQETESYPYMKYQTAPPVITSKLTSGTTTISGNSVDGGTIYYIDKTGFHNSATSSGNSWSINTTALNSGDEIRVYALANGKEPSYYVTGIVSYQGTGTESDPYIVGTEADLQNITKSGYYKLSKDLSLSSSWKSVGANGLQGVHIDGDSHTVTINNGYGLFAYLTNGSVKNMTIKVAESKTINTASYDDSRAIVVSSANGSAFSNLTVSGNVTGGKYLGGLVGTSSGCTYNSVTYEGKLTSPTGSGAAGGICAKSTNDKLEGCNVKSTITASNTVNAGGIIGSCETTASTLTKITAEANINVTGDSSKAGGVVGNGMATISQSMSKGTVKATGSSSYAGGILGYNANAGNTISDSYSTADVNGSAYAAGIAAYTKSAITRCYAMGNISGVEKGAGVVGILEGSSAKLTKSVASTPTLVFTATSAWASRVIWGYSNGAPDPDNSNYALKTMQVTLNGTTQTKSDDPMEGIAKTKDELQTESFYKSTLGWDMTNIWTIKAGEYPTLKWLASSAEFIVNAKSSDESMGIVAGSGTYAEGSEVTLTATPNDGYEFVKWSNGTTANPYTFIVSGDVTLTATFQKIVADDPIPEDPSPSEIEPSTDVSLMDYALYFNDVESRAGDLTLELNLKNKEEDITAYQCDVYLPEGVEWKYTTDKRGRIVYDMPTFNEDRTDTGYHTITPIAKNADGSYNIIVYSMEKEVILENDGVLMNLPLTISEEMKPGDCNIFLKNVVITNVNVEQVLIDKMVSKLTIPSYTIGDANGDTFINVTDIVSVISNIRGEESSDFIKEAADVNGDTFINVTDIVGIIDIIRGGASGAKEMTGGMAKSVRKAPASAGSNLEVVPYTLAEGTTTSTVKLEMNNPDEEFTAFQCDVYFPEGISWATTVDKRGKEKVTQPTFDASADRTDASYHTVDVGKNTNGSFNIIVYSMDKEIFLEEAGAILDMPFVYDADLAPGIYDITLKNIVLTRVDQTDVKPADYTFSVMVGTPAENNIVLNGDFTAEAIADYNSVIGASSEILSVDLSNATAVDNSVEIVTGNKDAIIYVADGVSVKNTKNVVVGDECASLSLVDGYSFSATKPFTAVSATYDANVSASLGYKTLVLPYDCPVPAGFEAYEVGSVSGGELQMEKVMMITANKPVILKNAGVATMAASNVTIGVTDDNLVGGELIGTYEEIAAPVGSYVLQNHGGNVAFYQVGEGVQPKVGAFRAYLAPQVAGAKMISVNFGDTTTRINEFDADGADETVFNVAGQRVSKSHRGVNVIRSNDGVKKVFVK